jgi:hypothetical protein
MVDMWAVARRLTTEVRRLAVSLRGMRQALVSSDSLDPELDEWARTVFGELRKAPLVQPTRDVVEAVLQRLKGIDREQSNGANDGDEHIGVE